MLEQKMTYELHRVVGPEHTASAVKSGTVDGLATPVMLAWMEQCCMDCVKDRLEAGQGTVGTHLDVSHDAPTPVGVEVTVRCCLEEIDGRKLCFTVEAIDNCGVIGRGEHERFVVDTERFQAKCDRKKDRQ